MSTIIKRLKQGTEEFVPITLAEAVVVKTDTIPNLGNTITTLDQVLSSIVNLITPHLTEDQVNGLIEQQLVSINAALSEKPDISKFGNGFDIDDNGNISIIPQPLYKIVESLPNNNINNNQIYLVPNDNNEFSEYIYVTDEEGVNKWEFIGNITSGIDAGNLTLKSDFDELKGRVDTLENITIPAIQASLVTAENIKFTDGDTENDIQVNYSIDINAIYGNLISNKGNDHVNEN